MRRAVLASIAVLLVNSDLTVATGRSMTVTSKWKPSTGLSNVEANRFLRGPESEDMDTDTDEESSNEERGVFDSMSARVSEIIARLQNMNVRAKTVNDLDDWIKDTTRVWHSRAKLNLINNNLAKDFKTIEGMGYNPSKMKERLKIGNKLETMDDSALMNDGDYLLWRAFTEHWDNKLK
ncbi:RxLR effector protein [Phytophthora megakarya]|uniref:RxLR effector protein n=1 Tax=Phytophthora megakarya TaxID=4795 RepID=A0A225X654_9STRA|nr:RxLR effector protein [Phytophthora megakarya]